MTGCVSEADGVDMRAPAWSKRMVACAFNGGGVPVLEVDGRILERCIVACTGATSDRRKRSQGCSYVYMVLYSYLYTYVQIYICVYTYVYIYTYI